MSDKTICSDDRRINEAVCIDTKRIFDSCVSKDCLENLRVAFFPQAQQLVDHAVTVKSRDCSVEAVSIDVDEVPFNRGFYNVDITFYFKTAFDCYSAPCSTPHTAVGYCCFNKKCILYGSDGNAKVFISSPASEALDCPEAPQYTNPTAKIQAVDPVILDVDVIDSCHCRMPLMTSMPQSILKNEENKSFSNNSEKAVLITIGLFSIVQMERDVQITIPAFDYCIPEKKCDFCADSPCDTFSKIEFPLDEFFPKDKDDCDSCSCDDD